MNKRPGRGAPSGVGRSLSYDVRIWKIRKRERQKGTTYEVRWAVTGEGKSRPFRTSALADSFRSKLISHAKEGVPFDVLTGLPLPMLRQDRARSWYAHACAYVDMKWAKAAPKSRRSMAESLATVTLALLRETKGAPPTKTLRAALYRWAFVKPVREAGPPPRELARAVAWMERNTVDVGDLEDPEAGAALVRQALDAMALKLDGKPAAGNTVARKRAVFYNALEYAVELGLLNGNPIDRVKWRTPKTVEVVDKRVVVNAKQAAALLDAVGAQGDAGQRLVAFFALLYYAGARPAEALDVVEDSLIDLPVQGWGEILLTNSLPRSGTAWTDSGRSREQRGLKHRANGDTRPVPAHPTLVTILRAHLKRFGVGRNGRLFVGPYGGLVAESTYYPVWAKARKAALTPAEYRSPLARRPYDLRHAAVSTWLNAGVDPTKAAEWAGHSVAVLLRVYAKCISGQDQAAMKRIEEAMNQHEQGTESE
jgi:integrase